MKLNNSFQSCLLYDLVKIQYLPKYKQAFLIFIPKITIQKLKDEFSKIWFKLQSLKEQSNEPFKSNFKVNFRSNKRCFQSIRNNKQKF